MISDEFRKLVEITPTAQTILEILAHSEKPLSVNELSELTGVAPVSCRISVRQLIMRGFVEKHPDLEGYVISAKGDQFTERVIDYVAKRANRVIYPYLKMLFAGPDPTRGPVTICVTPSGSEG